MNQTRGQADKETRRQEKVSPDPIVPQSPALPLLLCPACGCRDLFIRKNFPQKIGLTLVILAAVGFLILAARPATFYIAVWVLIVPVVIDTLLYFFVPRITVCYRCRAEFKGPLNPEHHGFDLATGEKYRSLPKV